MNEESLKKDLENLDSLTIEEISNMEDNPSLKAIRELTNPKNDERLTELSKNEVKQLTRIKTIADFTGSQIDKTIYETYTKLMISKERKGRTKLEEIGVPKVLDFFSNQKKGLFSHFSRNKEV